MLRTVCVLLLFGSCLAWHYPPKPKTKKCYSCEFSPGKTVTKTIFKTEEFEEQIPMTKVHCWYSFKLQGKVYEVDTDTAQSKCAHAEPRCKTTVSYKTVKRTRKVPMEVTEMTPSGGFKGCKGPINKYNEKKLGVDAWECYGKCFIRKDYHGRVARGCFSQMENVDDSEDGCSVQDGQLYCFCDDDRCNGQKVESD